jgi:hypothetical protein
VTQTTCDHCHAPAPFGAGVSLGPGLPVLDLCSRCVVQHNILQRVLAALVSLPARRQKVGTICDRAAASYLSTLTALRALRDLGIVEHHAKTARWALV